MWLVCFREKTMNRQLSILLFSMFTFLFFSNVSVFAQNNEDSSINHENKVVVLMYHHIDEVESDYTITPERFENDMKTLKENGFTIISLEEFKDFILKKQSIPPNAVLITFDDGYESFYKSAYPILKKYDFTATNFVIVSSIDHTDPASSMSFLNWEQMREMTADGMSFSSHTYDQHRYRKGGSGQKIPMLTGPILKKETDTLETIAEYAERVESDLSLAKKRIEEELGITNNTIGIPYGAYNQLVLDTTEKLGIDLVFTSDKGIQGNSGSTIFRLNVGTPDFTPTKVLEEIKKYKDIKGASRGQQVTLLNPIVENYGFYEEVFIPAEEVFSLLGTEIIKNDHSITVMSHRSKMVLNYNSHNLMINGNTFNLLSPIKYIDGKLMIPIGAFDYLDEYSLHWDETAQKVYINSK